jgi:hypothetical protein
MYDCNMLQRKEALKEIGRQQRHATLQRHRNSLSPADLKVTAFKPRSEPN